MISPSIFGRDLSSLFATFLRRPADTPHRLRVGVSILLLAGFGLQVVSTAAIRAQELGQAALQIAGTRLTVAPEGQTVPFDTPTLVETTLDGYDTSAGVLPSDVVVRGDFSGPGVQQPLRLETLPNEPFRIPRLRQKGEYRLENIRLMQGDVELARAYPEAVTVLATQVLITRVSSRAMTEDEMRSHGIVISGDDYQAFNLTFGFGVQGREVNYNMPLVYRLFGPGGGADAPISELRLPDISGNTASGGRFKPPRVVPFRVELEETEEERQEIPTGGCDLAKDPPCRDDTIPPPPMVGVVLFPTDVNLLHQFFSVVLTAQNGAPEGDPLAIRNLTTKVHLPPGLRAAETDPPTSLGSPIPLRIAGPDGQLDTHDDLLIAQATAEAEIVVQGAEQGNHIVDFELAGILEGMPGGPRPIYGSAKGAVVVRDPTLGVSLAHPDRVLTGEGYELQVTITNFGNAPVNGISFDIESSGLSGVTLAEGQSETENIGSLLPGDSASVSFDLVALRTGRIVASSVRSGSALIPDFGLSTGVENGDTSGPGTIVLPRSSNSLPSDFLTEALGLLSMGLSIADAPNVHPDFPDVEEWVVHQRVYQLAQAGRHLSLGQTAYGDDRLLWDSLARMAVEWTGAAEAEGNDRGWGWDQLRREQNRGLAMTVELADILATEPTWTAFEKMADAAYDLRPQLVAVDGGSAVRLELSSRTSGKRLTDDGAARELPFADIYPLNDGALGVLATPEDGGYRATITRESTGGIGLRVLLEPELGQSMSVRQWSGISLDPGEVAWVDFDTDDGNLVLKVDSDGDGIADETHSPSAAVLPMADFQVLAAVQNSEIDPSGHVIDVLFSSPVDLETLYPRDPDHFVVPGFVSNGGILPVEENQGGGVLGEPEIQNLLEGLFDPQIVRVVFDNPMGNLETYSLFVDDLLGVGGQPVGSVNLPITTTVDQPGIRVEGRVIDPYGNPLPGAEVSLYEVDRGSSGECVRHRTAAVISDAQGSYSFGYVRQTDCSEVFEIEAKSLSDPYKGKVQGRVRLVGETKELDVVMLGRARVKGKVTYDDGTVPSGLMVAAYNPLADSGRRAWVGDDGSFQMADVAVGTVTLWAQDGVGNRVYQTIEVPTAGAEVERDLVMFRRPDPTVGQVSGTVVDHLTGDPVAGAYLALYVDGGQVDVRRSDLDGSFDFGTVPTGTAEIEAFDGASYRRAAQIFFDIDPDEHEVLELRLRDDRGQVSGHVRRIQSDGSVVGVSGAVVWAKGSQFHTTTDENGYYLLEDVFTGNWTILAADLVENELTSVVVSVQTGQDQVADLYFEEQLEQRGARLTGTVLDEAGSPVKGATIHLSGGYWSVLWHHEATTDENGDFEITDLEPGTYGVHAYKGQSGGVGWAQVRFPGDDTTATVRFQKNVIRGQTKQWNDGNPVGVESIVVYRHVKVEDEFQLVVVSADYETITTDQNGNFEIEALHGPYELIFYNAFDASSTHRIKGELDELAPFHEVIFEENGSIGGVVYREDGLTPAVGAVLELRGGQFADYDLVADENGEYRFELIPPGRYTITATYQDGLIERKTRVWVGMKGRGTAMDIDIVLPAQGKVEGFVHDANGIEVPGAVVTLQERGWPHRRIVHTADQNGSFLFENIFAGEITIRAKSPELGGIGGSIVDQIVEEGQEVFVDIELEGTGEVQGRVLHPETGEPVVNARVRLMSGSLYSFIDSTSTDNDGFFYFDHLKLRDYRLRVFDPTTGRRGQGPWMELTSNGEVLHQDVVLEVRGTVEGNLYDPDAGNATVPGATIQLHSKGLAWFKTYSSTDSEGYFDFEGIPEGLFELKTFDTRRKAKGEGEITEENEVVRVDLYLERQARVTGTILTAPRLDPDTGEVVGGEQMEAVNMVLYRQGELAGASTDNPFLFDNVLAGSYHLIVKELNGGHRVEQYFKVREGEDAELTLRMRAIGSVRVRVLDSIGNPVNGAQVHVFNSYSYQNGAESDHYSPVGTSFDGNTGADEEVIFDGIRQGRVKVLATDVINDLRGVARGVLQYDGEEVLIEVNLQPVGTVQGQVLLSDGLTPAAGAIVALDATSRDWQVVDADANGNFVFDYVPLGSYTLIAQELNGAGAYTLPSSLDADQEVDDHTLILDDEDPYVVSVTPEFGTRDLPRTVPLVVQFSEPMRACGGSCSSWITVAPISASTQKASMSYAWSADRTTLTLTPVGQLLNDTGYKLVVSTSFTDDARRPLAWKVVSSFYTADEVPPSIIRITPAANAAQVESAEGIEIQFNEPLDLAGLSGAFELIDLSTGSPLTLTTQPSLDARTVVLSAVGGMPTDTEMEVRVLGVKDPAGNTQTQLFTSRFQTVDTQAPAIGWNSPGSAQTFVAGDAIDVDVSVDDARGVDSVTLTLGEWSQSFPGPGPIAGPFTWTVPAPVMETAAEVQIEVEAVDIYGNVSTSIRTLWITPLDNAVPPTVAIGCPVDLDYVAPGIELRVSFPVSDDLSVESAWLTVDGGGFDQEEVDRITPIFEPSADIELFFTPPAETVPGTSFALTLEARDFAGNITSVPFTVSTPTGTVLDGTAAPAGHDLVAEGTTGDLFLAAGRFDVLAPWTAGSVVLLQDAELVADPSLGDTTTTLADLRVQCDARADLEILRATTDVTVEKGGTLEVPSRHRLDLEADRLVVEAGARVDGLGRGYQGEAPGSYYGPWGPAGLTWPTRGGGSHGGLTKTFDGTSGGEIYDSVYAPSLAGGGGSMSPNTNGAHGMDGGGVVRIDVRELVLDGTIDLRGEDAQNGDFTPGAGAGGALDLDADILRGSGTVLASGGMATYKTGSGGGGRVALRVQSFDGFDPAAQVDARGGTHLSTQSQYTGFAAPGTVYVHTAGSVYGDLRLDNGRIEDWEAVDTPEILGDPRYGELSPLPDLGTGAVVGTQVTGSDLWLIGASSFRERWLGAWVRLEDGAGTVLGTFRASELDDVRLLLEGAGAISGAVTYRGIYRFDAVDLGAGTRLRASDPLEIGNLSIDAQAEIDAPMTASGAISLEAGAEWTVEEGFQAASLTLGDGARMVMNARQPMVLDIAGTLTVGTGAVIDVTGFGYLGGDDASGLLGYAPAGIQGAAPEVGSSYGGRGWPGDAGETYDSVYRPTLSAAGAGSRHTHLYALRRGGSGGGRLVIDADELVLDGTLDVSGGAGTDNLFGGAGGTVLIEVSKISGAGQILADGHEGEVSAGGGGRVALWTAELAEFDPATQISTRGGSETTGTESFASPGPIFVHASTGTLGGQPITPSTYGELILRNGFDAGGEPRNDTFTEMPILGEVAITASVVDGANLRLTAGSNWQARWLGTWPELLGSDGSVLGDARVLSIEGADLVLEGAAAHAGQVTSLRGLYRFDRVRLLEGSRLKIDDWVEASSVEMTDDAHIDTRFRAGTLDVAPNAHVRPIAGNLVLRATGRITIGNGALLDVVGQGYDGGSDATNKWGVAPPNVAPSAPNVGGSHGGGGYPGGDYGETYGSVYRPSLWGAGAGTSKPPNIIRSLYAGDGGGLVELVAGEVVLDGTIDVSGETGEHDDTGGAGGTVYIETDLLSGTGQVVARGLDGDISAGGGGRVAIIATAFSGFDPATQVDACGGLYTAGVQGRAGAGTIYVLDGDDTYGSLRLNACNPTGLATRDSELPKIGNGTVGAIEIDALVATDLWIEPTDPNTTFDVGALGMWVRINGTDYRVLAEQTDRRRLLLADAVGAVNVGDAYRGFYKFDRVDVENGADLIVEDWTEVGVWDVDPGSDLTLPDQTPPQIDGVTLGEGTPIVAGTSIATGQTISILANASDGTGTLDRVEFLLEIPGQTDLANTVNEDADPQTPFQWDLALASVSVTTSATLTVTVFDTGANSASQSISVVLEPVSPPAFVGDGLEGSNVEVTGNFTVDPAQEPVTATIDWGDGSAVEAATVTLDGSGGAAAVGNHVYEDNGAYTVTVTLTDNLGGTQVRTGPYAVANVTPAVDSPFGLLDVASMRTEDYAIGNSDWCSWQIDAAANRAKQPRYCRPTLLVDDRPVLNRRIEGEVNGGWGGGFWGLALGVEEGDTAAPDADYLLMVWRRGNYSPVTRGLRLFRMRGPGIQMWDMLAANELVATAATRGSADWPSATTVGVEVELTEQRLRIWIDGTLEFDLQGDYSYLGDGGLGFYAYDGYSGGSNSVVQFIEFELEKIAVAEGDSTALETTFRDPGLLDTHTASMTWSDGEPGTVALTDPATGDGVGSLSTSRAFDDQSSTDLSADICATDNDGAEGCASLPVSVIGVAPTVVVEAVAPATVGQVDLGASFTDAVGDSHTVTVDWGDGSAIDTPTVQVLGSGASRIDVQHTYASGGQYPVTVTVTDDDGEVGTATGWVTQLAAGLDITSLSAALATEGQSAQLDATYSATATSATVEWGDGSAIESVTATAGTVTATHVYAQNGVYTARLCVGGTGMADCQTATVTVINAIPALGDGLGLFDYTDWSNEGFPRSSHGKPAWTVSTSPHRVKRYDGNAVTRPAVFVGDVDPFGRRIRGDMTMHHKYGFPGFVLGFRPGDTQDPNADFLLLTWKKFDESTAVAGLRLFRVTGTHMDLWGLPNEQVELLASSVTYGSGAWSDNVLYDFEIDLTDSRLRIWMDGVLEFDVADDFSAMRGSRFGFYGYAKTNYDYFDFRTEYYVADDAGFFSLDLPFADLGVEDVHTASVTWSDGPTGSLPVVVDGDSKVVRIERTLPSTGYYTADVCVTDNGGGTNCVTLPINGPLAAPPTDQTPPQISIITLLDGTPIVDGTSLEGGLTTPILTIANDAGGAMDRVDYLITASGHADLTGSVTADPDPSVPVRWDAALPAVAAQAAATLTVTAVDTAGNTTVATRSLVLEPSSASFVGDGLEGSNVEVTADFLVDPSQEPVTVVVDWGDGQSGDPATVTLDGSGGAAAVGNHVYGDNGNYTVTLTLTDNLGGSQVRTGTYVVGNVPPTLRSGLGSLDFASLDYDDYPVGWNGMSSWTIDEPNDRVYILRRTRPSVMFGTDPILGRRISGELYTVWTSGYCGLVLGYRDGDSAAPDADYLVLNWRRGTKTNIPRGLRLFRVRGHATAMAPMADHHELIAEAATLANTDWPRSQPFDIELQVTEKRLQVWVDGNLEFDVEQDFSFLADKGWGFYAYDGDSAYSYNAFVYRYFQTHEAVAAEGSAMDLEMAFGDVGVLDSHVGSGTWDDGEPMSVTVTDSATGDGLGRIRTDRTFDDESALDYSATLCVTDDDGGQACEATIPVAVQGIAAEVSIEAVAAAAVGSVDLGASFTDAAGDTHTVSVDWGDGSALDSPTVQVLGGGASRIDTQHTYAAGGQYEVTVTVTDDDGEIGSDSLRITQLAAGLEITSLVAGVATEGTAVNLDGIYTGTATTATVDWGDGSARESVSPSAGSVSGSHAYVQDGLYTAELCVGGTAMADCDTVDIAVGNSSPVLADGLGLFDYTDWQNENYARSSHQPPTWTVSTTPHRLKRRGGSSNERPAVFYGAVDPFGRRIRGDLSLHHQYGYVGLVMGFQPGDSRNPESDYLFLTWKKITENTSAKGLRLFRVRGSYTDMWTLPNEKVELLAESVTYANSGWSDHAYYDYEIDLTDSHVRIWIDGTLEFDVAGDFSAMRGSRFGFYGYTRTDYDFFDFRTEHYVSDDAAFFSLDLPFSDLGVDDAHTASVTWSDGPTGALPVVVDGDSKVVRIERTLPSTGFYTADVCVTDEAGDSTCVQLPINGTAPASLRWDDGSPPEQLDSGPPPHEGLDGRFGDGEGEEY